MRFAENGGDSDHFLARIPQASLTRSTLAARVVLMAVLSDRAIAVVRDSRFLLWEHIRPFPAQEKQSDFTPNCPESALSSRCRSGEDILLVRLRPIQEATFLRWLAQDYRYCARRVDSGKDQHILFLRLQTFKNRTPLRWQPRKTLKERGGAPISLGAHQGQSARPWLVLRAAPARGHERFNDVAKRLRTRPRAGRRSVAVCRRKRQYGT